VKRSTRWQVALLGAVCAAMALAPALGLETQGNTLILSPEEAAQCQRGNGCVVIPVEMLRRALSACKGMT
jgi:hypothetical protein